MSKKYTFKCIICKKYYKSRQSLSNHKLRFHNDGKPKVNISPCDGKPKVNIYPNDGKPKVNILVDVDNEEECKKYKCDFCDKKYMYKQSKYRHQKKCKNNLKTQNDILKKEKEEMKIFFENEIQNMRDNIMNILKKNCKMHPNTLKKINRQLSQENNNFGIINNIVNNYNITNNYIVELGNENLIDVLSQKEQIMILNKKQQSLNHLIEYIHFNDNYPQFQNIALTNMKDNLAHMYVEEKNQFITVNKDDLLDNVIDSRMMDIEDFYNNNENQLKNNTKDNIKKFIGKVYNDDKYYNFKKNDIKLLLYNNRCGFKINEIKN
jgi:hypothetical protein